MSCIAPNSNCMQNANDSTLHHSCKLKEKGKCIKELKNYISLVAKWSDETNLVFNTDKTNFILITKNQMSVQQRRTSHDLLQPHHTR